MDADETDEHGWLTAIRVHQSHSKFLFSNAHCLGVILVSKRYRACHWRGAGGSLSA